VTDEHTYIALILKCFYFSYNVILLWDWNFKDSGL
jgi:hypothetical protein